MDNRDNIFEQQIKTSEEKVPESLRPENIEKKLAMMTQDERYNRSQSEDIPEGFKGKAVKDKSKNKKKIVLPIVIAASVLLLVGAGVIFALNRNKGDAETGYTPGQGLGQTEDENKEEEKSDKNYKKAYRTLKNYKEMMNNAVYEDDVDYVEEDAEDAVAEESTSSANSSAKNTIGIQSGDSSSRDAESYTDTNVRTEGVGEADIIKTDGKYIYVYEDSTEHIFIYSVDKGTIEKIGSANILEDDVEFNEMYIYEDKLVLMGDVNESGNYYNYADRATCVSIFDITDRTNPKLDKRVRQDGMYTSSRMVGNVLYTFSEKTFNLNKIRSRKYETYVPEIDGEILKNNELIVVEDSYNNIYQVVSSIDVNEAKVIDKMAVLGGNDNLYVSSENIYMTDRAYDWNSYGYKDTSSIIRISYTDGDFKYEAEGTFPGYLNDDYSIDEYDGYVRLVTSYRDKDYTQYNGLYVLNTDLEKVSVIKKLAEGETIKSARFMGEAAYFVTFRNMDPLFAVDLTDPENPRVTDYLKIPGYSAYLHPYGEDKLLGIGYDIDEYGWGGSIKLSMFDVSDPFDIQEIDKKTIYNYNMASVLSDRRAFMFNEEDGTFGFSAGAEWGYSDDDDWYEEYYGEEFTDWADNVDFSTEGSFYTVYDYDDSKGFECKLDVELDEIYSSYMGTRGIVIGDYLYIVQSGKGIASYDTTDYKLVDECY